MRGLVDRITNRDRIEELGATIKEQEVVLREKELVVEEQAALLQELEEKAELLTGSIRVLKMRFDTIFPATTMEREVDERGTK